MSSRSRRNRALTLLTIASFLSLAGFARALTYGDLNNDGKVDVSDVILTLRAAVGIDTLTPQQKLAADVAPAPVNGTIGDGQVNVTDATMMLRFITGLIPGLGGNVPPPGVIPSRAATLKGKVFTREGQALPDVTVSVLNNPQFGTAKTSADGSYSITVNGGGSTVLEYAKNGFLPAQRKTPTAWKKDAALPDVALVPLDSKVTTVDLSGNAPLQVAQGNPVTDPDGTRTQTLLIPSGTTATLVKADGSVVPAPALNVRATEYTVGPNGPKAMPGELPPTSGYTYAVELSADEAIQSGAKEVRFNKPVYSYTDNFLEFPVGTIVPAGYYDREKAIWVPSDNGKVIKVLATTGGLATLDTDGDGQADTAEKLTELGVNNEELAKIAGLYEAGKTLWRTPIPHFTPWDLNWPYGCTDDNKDGVPDCAPPHLPQFNDWNNDPCKKKGSIIDVQNQSLGERVNVVGTPFSLSYYSDRMQGRKDVNKLTIPLTGGTLPHRIKGMQLQVMIGGKLVEEKFTPGVNKNYTVEWDGQNENGPSESGVEPVLIRLGYTYPVVYLGPAPVRQSFAQLGGIPLSGSRPRMEITLWQEQRGFIANGKPDVRDHGMGGWTLNVHHAYDPKARVLYFGDGSKRNDPPLDTNIMTTYAGRNGRSMQLGDGGPANSALISAPSDVKVAPDGTLYLSDSGHGLIRKVTPEGVISTVAGDPAKFRSQGGFSGDGGPAIQAEMNDPSGFALGPDGSLYIADRSNNRVRKVSPDGIITTFAGNGQSTNTQGTNMGDGGPATQATLNLPSWIAVGPDGSVYISDHFNGRVRRVDPAGIITTVAGGGSDIDWTNDPKPANDVRFDNPGGVAVGPDGALYVAETGKARIRRVGPDGMISTFAGTGVACEVGALDCGDGAYATEAMLRHPTGLDFGPDGSLYVTDTGSRVRRITPDGIIQTVAGGPIECEALGSKEDCGDNGPATLGNLRFAQGVAVAPDGSFYVAEGANWTHPIRKISPADSSGSRGAFTFPSSDGSQIYVFDQDGRHQRTADALTGLTLYLFGYDGNGRLSTITDKDGNATTLERDPSGIVTSILGPFGHRTNLKMNGEGYLEEAANPVGSGVKFTYTNGGLLRTMTDPNAGVYTFTFDSEGRLTKDEDPSGGFKTLTRLEEGTKTSVTVTTAMGRKTVYQNEVLEKNTSCSDVIRADGLTTRTETDDEGVTTTQYPNGVVQTSTSQGDPRFGTKVPMAKSLSIKTPGGRNLETTTEREVEMASVTDALSLKSQTETVTRNGRRFVNAFDAEARTLTVTSPEGRKTVTTLDEKGRPVLVQSGTLAPMAITYDARGFPKTVTQAAAGGETRSLTYGYNAQGDLETILDALDRKVTFVRDPLGRMTTQTQPDGAAIGYEYDGRSNPTGITPPGRPKHVQGFTPTDLPSSYNPASSGQTVRYEYDKDGQIVKVTRPDGKIAAYTYDAAGRPETITSPDGILRFTYEPQTGQLASVASPSGIAIAHTYDGSLMTEEKWTGPVAGTLSRIYDNNFWVISSRVNGQHAVGYGYDRDGLLVQAGDLSLDRVPQTGQVKTMELGKTLTTMGYNGFGEPASSVTTANGATLLGMEYGRDKSGRIVEKKETVGGVTSVYTYHYDAANRLKEERKDGVTVATFTYDPNGNRLTETGTAGVVTGVYDDQDRVTSYGTATFTWSPNGEMQTKTEGSAVTTYRYDAFGNLKGVTLPDGREVEYLLDGNYRRAGKKVNGALVQSFLYEDALRPAVELDGQGKVASRFVYGGQPGAPVFIQKGNVTYRVVADHLGSPRLVVNAATGEIVQRMDFDAFGNVLQDTNPGFQPFGFAGGLYDRDTGLAHFGAREYDAKTGRWTRRDPILFQGRQGNLYAYVNNNPVMKRDPSGLLTATQCNRLRQVKEFEKEHGTWETARKFSNTPGYYERNTPLGDAFDNQPIETAIGTIDLDWYTDIAAYGGTAVPHSPLPTAIYVFGKNVWNLVRWWDKGKGGAAPFEDKKEGVALDALEWGYSYNDLFPEEFLRHVCPCQDTPAGETPPPATKP